MPPSDADAGPQLSLMPPAAQYTSSRRSRTRPRAVGAVTDLVQSRARSARLRRAGCLWARRRTLAAGWAARAPPAGDGPPHLAAVQLDSRADRRHDRASLLSVARHSTRPG